MIYIVHGENVSKARTLILNQQRSQNVETRKEFDTAKISPQQLSDALSTTDLFGGTPFVVLNITKAAKTDTDKFVEVIKKAPKNATLILLSEKDLTNTSPFIKTLPGAKILATPEELDASVFKFIDTVFSKKRISAYKELLRLKDAQADDFYLFSMLLYALRNVAYVKFSSSLTAKMAPFARGKALSQAKQFNESQVRKLFAQFSELDKKAKTGGIPPELLVTATIEKVLNCK